MSTTDFESNTTVIEADWLNDVDDAVYNLIPANTVKIGDIRSKTVEMGSWNMDTTASSVVNHGLDYTKIRAVSAMIKIDSGASVYDFAATSSTDISWDNAQITLNRPGGGFFDDPNFDAITSTRGWVVIQYID